MKKITFVLICFMSIFMSCNNTHHTYTVGPNIPCQDSIQFYIEKADKGDEHAQYIAAVLLQRKQTSQDSIKAFQYFSRSAENGFVPSERAMSHLFLDSTSMKFDKIKGIEWLTKSANHGHVWAILELAEYYIKGDGVEQNFNKALELNYDGLNGLHVLAESGDTKAQYQLGQIFAKGNYFKKDLSQAKFWLQKSAEANNAFGQLCYGLYFEEINDYKKAFYWLSESNNKQLFESYSLLAELYRNGLGTEQDLKKAFELNLAGAKLGDRFAMFRVAYSYSCGEGCDVNKSEAFKWYKKLADKGDESAQNNIGAMYASGDGVTKDEKEAFKWYLKAAKGGNSLAECNVGRCYFAGRGVEKDLTEAFNWFTKSAEHGNVQGYSALSYCYMFGIGIPKNIEMAAYWEDKANVR